MELSRDAGSTLVGSGDVGALLRAAADGDEDAVLRLYRVFGAEFERFARSRGAEDAEGTANVAFYDAIRALPNLRRLSESVFCAYAYRSIRSRVAGEHRRHKLEVVSLPDGWWDEQYPWSQLSTEQLVVGEHNFEFLLKQVTPAQREVLRARFQDGCSLTETAARLDRSPAAVRQMEDRALGRLYAWLAIVVILVVAAASLILEARSVGVETPVELVPTVPEVDRDASTTIERQASTVVVDGPVVPPVEDGVDDASKATQASSTTTEGIGIGKSTVAESGAGAGSPAPTASPVDDGIRSTSNVDDLGTTVQPAKAQSTTTSPEVETSAAPTTEAVSATTATTVAAASSALCLGAPNGGAAGTALQMQSCDDNAASQLVVFLPADIKIYGEVTVGGSDACIRPASDEDIDGVPVVTGPCGTSSGYTRWRVDGSRLRNFGSDLCLTASDSTPGPATPLQLWSCGNAPFQDFSISSASVGGETGSRLRLIT